MVIPVGVVDQELRVLTKQADGQLRRKSASRCASSR